MDDGRPPEPLAVDELVEALSWSGLELDGAGVPVRPLILVDLNAVPRGTDVDRAARALEASTQLVVGVAPGGLAPHARTLAAGCAFTVTDDLGEVTRTVVAVDDPAAVLADVTALAAGSPRAAATLSGLLRATASLSTRAGLAAESHAYSMLLAGPEFARWRARTPLPVDRVVPEDAVLVDRDGGNLVVTLNDPARRNAFGREIRDGLVDALELAELDRTIEGIELRGAGRAFCSGGDLSEFGSSREVVTAHLVRVDRSVAARIDAAPARTTAVLHGACIGAGIELPSFADRVTARPDAFFQLPEIAMGLVPGAGGTVGITRRIGRWRTAYLALTGTRLDVDRALEWGLVDARAD